MVPPIFRSTRRGAVETLILLIGIVIALALMVSGAGRGIDNDLRTMRASWHRHSATGDVVIIEVDARSLAAVAHWPWPRRHWTTALDRLGAAGARTIGFDIDLSSPSGPADDAQFAAALRRRGGSVILPTFNQYARSGSDQTLDTLPLDVFRQSAFVAGVNVTPDDDGVVRNYPLQITTRGVTRPSIGAMIVDAENRDGAAMFPIDYAIDPATIPRISFLDLLDGRVRAGALAGKRILIGATAIELGDRYPAPGQGVIPGVVIQALAAETLLQVGAGTILGPLPLVALAIGAIAAILWFARGRRRLVALGIAAVLMFVLPLPLEAIGRQVDLVPALGAVLAAFATVLAALLMQELRARRFIDQESGMPNAEALAAAGARNAQVDIVVARLDRLVEIAAAMGHGTSTAVLLQVVERLSGIARCTIFRVEEDTLAWIVAVDDDADAEADRFRSLVDATRMPVDLSGTMIDIRATFGVARGHGRDAKNLVAGAQIAARRIRSRGGHWDRYVDGDGDAARWELSVLGSLSEAIENGRIWVAYQPKVAAADGRIVGAEALVRWNHATRGMIPPDSFIPLVEAEGRMVELTAFVLDTAVRDLARWQRGGADVRVAVNLSATLLRDDTIATMVEAALAREGVDPGTLTLELTESAIVADTDDANATIEKLRALGVKLSIDDYGTGQSTLSYLKRFPVSELKIDKSFVKNIVRNPGDRLLVQSTVELAHAMGMTVVAEGVEDEACMRVLRSISCDTVQGWHTGKPMPATALGELLIPYQTLAA